MILLRHFSHVRLCVTPETAAHQAPPSLGFSRQEHWSGLPFLSPIDFMILWNHKLRLPWWWCSKNRNWQTALAHTSQTDPDDGKDWGQEEKWVTEDEMVGWHHRLNGHEFEQTLGDSEGQGSLAWCSPWGRKELDTTERLNNNKAKQTHKS